MQEFMVRQMPVLAFLAKNGDLGQLRDGLESYRVNSYGFFLDMNPAEHFRIKMGSCIL